LVGIEQSGQLDRNFFPATRRPFDLGGLSYVGRHGQADTAQQLNSFGDRVNHVHLLAVMLVVKQMQLIESRTSQLPNDTSYTSREAPSCRQEADSIVPSRNGFTLLELLIATTILSFLRLMAFPLARITIQRDKERRLRACTMGDARCNRQVRWRSCSFSDQSGQLRLSPRSRYTGERNRSSGRQEIALPMTYLGRR
jgi:prepilin-type N-terminal cleavage/methylation domain-containing protein